jgi:hypothetical protein
VNSPEIKAFIREHGNLFWYTPESEKENVSHELLVETILNYGDMDAVKKLFDIMGVKTTANVFFGMQGRKKLNFYPEIYSFFSLYFKKNA